MDSGSACLWMIVQYYDRKFREDQFQKKTAFGNTKVSLMNLAAAAEKIGFRARCVKLTHQRLIRDVPLPCIIQWDQQHFAVLLSKSGWGRRIRLNCALPAEGIVKFRSRDFIQHWIGNAADGKTAAGNVLILEPTFEFRNKYLPRATRLNWRIMLQFFQRSRLQITQVIAALLITSLFQLIIPFLMQSIVDVGIKTQDLSFIAIVLIAQVMLVISRLSVDIIRSRLMMHISTTVKLSMVSDFWIKLTRLPMSYFDRNHTGDIMQRINDNRQVQNFLTGPVLSTVFSILNFIVFGIVLMMYQVKLFIIFIIGMTLYVLWIQLFLSIRRKINHQLFNIGALESNTTIQMVQGMQEIRLNNIGQFKRWEWESNQVEIFRLNVKQQNYSQIQQAGALLINQGKDVMLTFMVAKLLIEGQLTFGAMLAVQYIIGQLSSPVQQLISFIQVAQDAKNSMERLNDIHQLEDEEIEGKDYDCHLPGCRSIFLENLSFSYPGKNSRPALSNINLEIPEGKTTAIVGESGSGKTTLIKLLLKIYSQYDGCIRVGDTDFKEINPAFWRAQCSSVLQDGFIFDDTIGRNISLQYEQVITEQLREACHMANILTFIESLPNGFDTRLNSNGVGISQGQKQRLLIARAMYKNPSFLFLDESTNSLDETNERKISENLQLFGKNRTMIVIAHRLSTVRNADKIIVLHQGRIVEEGTHQELARIKGQYFKLVKSQLELGIGEF